jgi:4-diphosphocytidyl-2-C-methyl-D-erythritol kinase
MNTDSNWNWQSHWPAPAKINLFLHVVGRRADGYHLLQTVFRFLDFADSLRFSPRTDGRVERATALAGVASRDDLVVRAAQLLREAADLQHGVDIHLDKRIPMGGGLGGGSSDAATTLIALNHLWQAGLTRAQLQTIGLQLGADVPVFIHGHSTFAEGIGEKFYDVTPPPAHYLLVMPEASVPTADIFRAPELVRDTPAIAPSAWQPGFGHNDLEAVACARYPAVADTLHHLRQLGPAHMSGSGACCFGEFPTADAAQIAQTQLPSGLRSHIVAGANRHPLNNLICV